MTTASTAWNTTSLPVTSQSVQSMFSPALAQSTMTGTSGS